MRKPLSRWEESSASSHANHSESLRSTALPRRQISLGELGFSEVECISVDLDTRSHENKPAPLEIDVENVEPIDVPQRRAADGALVPDWGQVPARVYTAGLIGMGHRTMTQCLQSMAVWISGGTATIDTFPWASLRFSQTTAIRAALARAVSEGRYAPATANKYMAALRGTMKAAWRMGMIGTDDYLRAVDLRPIAGARLPAGRDVEQSELAALLGVCRADPTPFGVRDAAVVALAYLSGTRRTELTTLRLVDVDVDPPAVRVIGKGDKERLVPLSPTIVPLLRGVDRAARRHSGSLVLPDQQNGRPPCRSDPHRRGDPSDHRPPSIGSRPGQHLAPRPAPDLRRRSARRRSRPARCPAAHGSRLPLDDVSL